MHLLLNSLDILRRVPGLWTEGWTGNVTELPAHVLTDGYSIVVPDVTLLTDEQRRLLLRPSPLALDPHYGMVPADEVAAELLQYHTDGVLVEQEWQIGCAPLPPLGQDDAAPQDTLLLFAEAYPRRLVRLTTFAMLTLATGADSLAWGTRSSEDTPSALLLYRNNILRAMTTLLLLGFTDHPNEEGSATSTITE